MKVIKLSVSNEIDLIQSMKKVKLLREKKIKNKKKINDETISVNLNITKEIRIKIFSHQLRIRWTTRYLFNLKLAIRSSNFSFNFVFTEMVYN